MDNSRIDKSNNYTIKYITYSGAQLITLIETVPLYGPRSVRDLVTS